MKDKRLLPCPFCGGKAIEEVRGRDYIVRCENRFSTCKINMRTNHCPTRKKAVEVWNNRKATK